VIIAEIIPRKAPKMGLMQNDDVVEQIVPKTSNPPFGNSVLPRAAVAGADGRNGSGSRLCWWSAQDIGQFCRKDKSASGMVSWEIRTALTMLRSMKHRTRFFPNHVWAYYYKTRHLADMQSNGYVVAFLGAGRRSACKRGMPCLPSAPVADALPALQ
jgi:hypothetical protein